MRLLASVAAAALCAMPAAALAQPPSSPPPAPPALPPAQAPAAEAEAEPEPAAEADAEVDDLGGRAIVVTGQRLRGAVEGDIPPEVTLDPREIRAFGASTVAELLQALAPQTSSGRGRGGGGGFPVVLVNGRRISSFSEIRDLPPEAIERVDILPEEVALRYGYRAEQRVVNLVLRERFNAVTAEIDGGLATAGGRGVGEVDVNYLTIQGPTRTSFDVEYQNQAALLESERDIIQTRPGPPGLDIGQFRTLLPETEQVSLSGNHSRMLGSVGATLDGRFVNSSSASLLGLPGDDPASRTPLGRDSETWNGHVGTTLNGTIAPWRWNLTANYDRVETDSVIQRLAAAPPDTAEQINQAATANLVASGPVLRGWAGPLNASVTVSGELRGFESESTRSGVFRTTSLSRERAEGQASFDMPLTSTREDVFDAIGDLSANLNLNAEYMSDFGLLTTIGYGLNWRPIEAVSVIASFTREEGAPGITQLGDPVIGTPNVRVFDFVRGETVDITRIDGGDGDLLADSRRVINLGINVRPIENLSIRANYTQNKIDSPIAGFPAATAEIEAAFPDRFVRDASGRLVSIDTRPINYAESERREFRWGVDFSGPLGEQRQGGGGPLGAFFGGGGRGGGQGGGGGRRPRPEGQPAGGAQQQPAGGAVTAPAQQPAAGGQSRAPEGQQAERPRGPGGGGPGGRGGFGGRGPFGGGGFGAFGGGFGRFQLGLFHTWRLEDRVLIREGGPELDFLNGSAAGSFGGTPRHQIQFQGGLFRDGLGARAEVTWQSGTEVRGVNGSDLFFSDRTAVNLRLFADLGSQRALVRQWRFLRGARVSINVDNLLDTRVGVRDASGETPLNFQPFLVDPLGRTVRFSFRKVFF